MTDKELIKQEIERRYNYEKCYPLSREANVAAAVLQELLLFIDSIPEEHYYSGEVIQDIYSREFHIKSEAINNNDLKWGDKVKIIIVKEDEQ